MSKRVGILIGGGDVPGLNVCLKSLVYRLIDLDFDPVGIRRGWTGLINYNFNDSTSYSQNFIELTKSTVRPIDRGPGSFLHASRINPLATPRQLVPSFLRDWSPGPQDLTPHLIATVERLDFRALIIIGDDETLGYAAHLSRAGVPIIAIPKTIHNNIYGTDATLGFSTGLGRGVSFLHELRALAASREQIVVVETFEVESGLSSLVTAFLAGVDRAVIPEVPYNPEKLAWLLMEDKRLTPHNCAVMTISNGSRPTLDKVLRYARYLSPLSKSALLRQMTTEEASVARREAEQEFTLDGVAETGSSLAGSGMIAAELLQHLTGDEVFLQPLTYLLRTGPPDGQDLLLAHSFAMLAAYLVETNRFGRMTAYYQHHRLTDVDLNLTTQEVKKVVIDQMYDAGSYQPTVGLIWATQMGRTTP